MNYWMRAAGAAILLATAGSANAANYVYDLSITMPDSYASGPNGEAWRNDLGYQPGMVGRLVMTLDDVADQTGAGLNGYRTSDFKLTLGANEFTSAAFPNSSAGVYISESSGYQSISVYGIFWADLLPTAGLEQLEFSYIFLAEGGAFPSIENPALPTSTAFMSDQLPPGTGVRPPGFYVARYYDSPPPNDAYDYDSWFTAGGELSDVALSITRVADPVSPAPEPGTWALLIAGLGLSGAALRRRRASIGPLELRV